MPRDSTLPRVALLLGAVILAPSLGAADWIPITIVEDGGAITAELQRPGAPPWTLVLHPYSHRAAGFSIFLDTGGTLVPFEAPALATVRGEIAVVAGSAVTGGIVAGRLWATIRLPGETWQLEPDPSGPLHLLHRHDDPLLLGSEFRCGTAAPSSSGATARASAAAGPGAAVAEIAYDVDQDLFATVHQSDPALASIAVELDHAQLQLSFEPAGVVQEIRAIIIRTQPGQPYTPHDPIAPISICELLAEVDAVWDPSSSAPFLEADGVQLLTFREGDGDLPWGSAGDCGGPGEVGGEAHAEGSGGLICGAFPTSVVLYHGLAMRRKLAMAHEWAHLWSADHCCIPPPGESCGILCGDPCTAADCGTAPLEFDPAALAAIAAHAAGAGCLRAEAPIVPAPFNEQFPIAGSGLEPPYWTFVSGAAVVPQTSPMAPTPAHALALVNGTFPATDLRTGRFSLAPPASWHVSMRILTVGVAPGELLIVQFLGSDHTWQPLMQLHSEELSSSAFTFRAAEVPAAASFDEFRVRFFIPEHGATGSWRVDDFRIRSSYPFARGDANADGSVNIADAITILSYLFLFHAPPTCLAPADVNDDSGVNIADAVAILGHLFQGGSIPAPFSNPVSSCGLDFSWPNCDQPSPHCP
jgi:hypothetical protein